MKTFLTYLITELINREPEVLDYVFVFEMITILDEEEDELKEKVKEKLNQAHQDNYEMEVDFTNRNLNEIGVPVKIDADYKKHKSKKIDKLVDKTINKMDKQIKSQMLNALNTKNVSEVINLLETFLKNQKKSNSLVSSFMRIFRTESTKMRSEFKIQAQKDLEELGFKVKRRWLHTLYNPSNVILDNYTPREDHLIMNGQLEDNSGYFHSPNYDTKAPGMFGIPEEDINCRCDVDFVLDE